MKKLKILLITFFSAAMLMTSTVQAQDPFVGEIRMFAGNFAPSGWALCDGQLLPIMQNDALFSLIGTFYGGDGRSTFALPDLRGRVAIHKGQGPGLTEYPIGDMAGQETVALTTNNLPSHTHIASVAIGVSDKAGNTSDPSNAILANTGSFDKEYTYGEATGTLRSANVTVGSTGGNQPVNIRQPYTTVNFIISLEGIYPSRN